jgi:hypothetical protein
LIFGKEKRPIPNGIPRRVCAVRPLCSHISAIPDDAEAIDMIFLARHLHSTVLIRVVIICILPYY